MILVTGANGNVGREVVRALGEAGAEVRALSRASGADLNRPATVRDALAGVDGVFLLAGYQDMPGLLAEIRDAGAGHVVLLSSGAVVGGDPANAVTRYNMDSEEAVRASGVPWTILRPSGFMSNALQWVPQLKDGDVVREPFANVPIAAIDPHDIGDVAARVLVDGPTRRELRLTGPEAILPADRVSVLAELLGRDLSLTAIPDDVARAEMSEAMPEQYVDAFFRYFTQGEYDDSKVHPTVKDVTGHPPRTFRAWATEHADAFR